MSGAGRRPTPRVEYDLTPVGARFVAILDRIEELETERSGRPGPGDGPA